MLLVRKVTEGSVFSFTLTFSPYPLLCAKKIGSVLGAGAGSNGGQYAIVGLRTGTMRATWTSI